jgi:hypothetical protein
VQMMVMSIQDVRGDTGVIVINDEGTSVAPVVRVLNNMIDVRKPRHSSWSPSLFFARGIDEES